jgi:hypothetical protein
MSNFIKGEINTEIFAEEPKLFYADTEFGGDTVGADLRVCPYYADTNTALMKREFSETARLVFKAGLDLWKYYHSQKHRNKRGGYNVNASLYDIREYFQERNEKGIMNSKSTDEKYNVLLENLRLAICILAKKIEPKVYEYGFLLN